MMYALLAGGFIILLVGGDFMVRGAVALAQKLDVPPLVIGLTIIALGTSAPEFVVSLKSVMNDAPGLAIGNVVGSNIANILLVLGLPAIIFPIACSGSSLNRDNLVMILTSVLFIIFCWQGVLVTWQGALFLVLLAAFLIHAYRAALKGDGEFAEAEDDFDGISSFPTSLGTAIFMIAAGMGGLIAGAQMLVIGAIDIARIFGVSEAVIGLTVVALGTSLPELTTSLVAAMRKHADVAIGNVVGSNLFNILGVIGATSVLMPVPVPQEVLDFDLWIMLAASLALVPFVLRRAPIGRVAGIAFTLAYLAYIGSQFSDHGISLAFLDSQ
ncbi:MAG: calcium/sodium antiporter [Alphaproteobacteria bacterium]|jgi:cation:H+ antiporter|nr:calcium/sodium antiporter [Alphaproteobacteria bacterium]MBT4083190.1 calcium/sodium antiporter [Alphaproteobacteria bacterium]MBT4546256.1 calcium/sodium antiporter [Alphaproteobacteria bacterium]MBT6385260.1 calcium/sodium antiporter [Alphaproteobacteria bacterium]MBT7747773.1 calcium/sodium antiporter [Alphaproteobacteria bacterium]